MISVRSVAVADPAFDQACELFDAYRVHYGQDPAPEQTRRWLMEQLDRQRFRVAIASLGGDVCGLITTTVIPASLTLRTAWLIRDLFVDPAQRRSGAARALLLHVIETARAEGALRLSLQTEPDNTAALSLYGSLGFTQVDGLVALNLPC
jgi:ribosomal protein S18 acetylase RimI-like enzyme